MTQKVTLNARPRQRGAVALLVSVILLISATLVVLYASRSALLEQKISANDVRAKQALAAAQAGVDHLFANVATNGVASCTSNCTSTTPTYSYNHITPQDLGNGTAYQATFCDAGEYSTASATAPTSALPACPTSSATTMTCASSASGSQCKCPGTGATRLVIHACGWSDDQAARQHVSQLVDTAATMASTPTNPLVALGGVDVGGSATVTNYYNNLTIWSGGPLTSIGNAGKSFVRNPTAALPTDNTPPPPPPTSCGTSGSYICTTDKSKVGPDVISNDLGLAGLTGGEFFKNFFGSDGPTYKQGVPAANVYGSSGSSYNIGGLDGKGGAVYWIDGGATTSGSPTIGVPAPNYNITDVQDAGYYGKPAVVIIDGDFGGGGGGGGNLTINGILYVGGNMNLQGNIKVNGIAIIQGTVSGTGSLDVVYDPRAAKGAGIITGPKAGLSGGWRDW